MRAAQALDDANAPAANQCAKLAPREAASSIALKHTNARAVAGNEWAAGDLDFMATAATHNGEMAVAGCDDGASRLDTVAAGFFFDV